MAHAPVGAGDSRNGGLVVIFLVIALAAAAGSGFSWYFAAKPSISPAGGEAPAQVAEPKAASVAAAAAPDFVLPLEPIMVNVGLSKRWLRLEGAVLFNTAPSKEELPVLARQLSADALGFLRSTSIAQLETAVGLEFILEDLTELARLRSQGRARVFVIKSLVIE